METSVRDKEIAEAQHNMAGTFTDPDAERYPGLLRSLVVGLDPMVLEFFADVLRERHHQDSLHHRKANSPLRWLAIFAVWTGKLASAVLKGETLGLRHRAVQVAAIALAMVELGLAPTTAEEDPEVAALNEDSDLDEETSPEEAAALQAKIDQE